MEDLIVVDIRMKFPDLEIMKMVILVTKFQGYAITAIKKDTYQEIVHSRL